MELSIRTSGIVIDGQMLQWDQTWPRKTDVSRPDPLFIKTARVSSMWSDFSLSSKCLKGEINADEMMGKKATSYQTTISDIILD